MSENIKTNIISFTLSSNELWFLMKQFAPAYVVGMENPHLGWLIEEIEQADRQAVQDLVAKDLVRITSENTIDVDQVIYSLVQVCVKPQHTLVVQQGSNMQRYIHFSAEWIVEHVEVSPGVHRVSAIRNRDALLDYLKDDLRLESAIVSQGKTFRLSEQDLAEAAGAFAAGKLAEGESVFRQAKLPVAIRKRLGEALAHPVANAAFVALIQQNNPDTQHTRGFAILESKDDLWMLRPVEKMGQAQVEFIPASAESTREKFIEILP